MTKLTTLASAVSFLAIVSLGAAADAGSERHRDSNRSRPVGANLLGVDTRETVVVSHGGIIAAGLQLTDEEGFARIATETKLAPQATRGLQVRAFSATEELEGSDFIAARPEATEKLSRTEGVRNLQFKPLTTSVSASELTSSEDQ